MSAVLTIASPLRWAVAGRLAVLRNRQFRRLLAGRTVSFAGDGLHAVASMWLVYELTGSTAYTGLAGFLSRAPTVLKVFAGPLVDRASLRRVLVLSEVGGVAIALLVPLAAASGHLHAPVVLAVVALMALSELFAAPAQNAVLPRLVPESSLVRANSAFSVVTRAADAAARAVGGAMIATVGAVGVYAVDAATYAAGAVAFRSLSLPERERDAESLDPASYAADLRDGLSLLGGSVAGLMLVGTLGSNLLTGAALAALPAFADAIGGPETYGLMLASTTAGAVVGSVAATAVDGLALGRTTVVGFAAAGALWVAAVALASPVATVALFGAARVPVGAYNVSVLSTFQTGVPNGLLGRVTAAASSATNLTYAVGLLVGGVAGTVLGSRAVVLAGGVGYALLSAYWLAVPSLRRFGPPRAVDAGEFE